MAWFSSRTKPSAEELGEKGYDSQGKKHSMLNYSSTVYTQSHMSQTERFFRFDHVNDDHHGVCRPPQISLFKDHGYDISKYSHFPSIVAYESPMKVEGFSPKELLKGAPWNSAGYKNHSPFSWDNDDHSTDDSDDENYHWHGGYGGSYLPKPVHTKPEYDTDYGMESPKGANRKSSFVPPPGRHQQYTVPISTSPKKDTNHETARNRPIGHSPPRNKPETDTQSPKTSWKSSFKPARRPEYSDPVSTSPKIDAYYETARNKPIGHSPPWSKPETDTQSPGAGLKPLVEPTVARHPQYAAPVSTSPKKDAYPKTVRNRPIGHSPPRSNPETDTQFPKSDWKPLFEPTAARHPQYTAPISTSPKKDAYHETSRNRPIGHSPPWSKPETDTQSSKTSWKPSFQLSPERHPQYSASIPTSPKKDEHYETANYRPIVHSPPRSKPESVNDYTVESPKDDKQTSFVHPTGKHPHYYAPDTTPPKKDKYYDTTKDRSFVPSPLQGKPESDIGYTSDSPKADRNPSFGSLSGKRPEHTPPVKDSYYEMANNSRPPYDNGKVMTHENLKPKYTQQPQVSEHDMILPRKEGHQQTIDSNEARKRYGGKAVNQEIPKEGYIGTIDSKELARKYNGVFVR
ncbi:Hypothetical predicted protein [Olea europaea subsp. europaea]|uniref:Uncharacterized protein n=1 Tax=Olea europaea subsp. europaea TaxID=158383 RepID=A0A8S0TJH2_OLEEU|nr:Hypothetical predicted protein [Olea europaea subsp. europaea]